MRPGRRQRAMHGGRRAGDVRHEPIVRLHIYIGTPVVPGATIPVLGDIQPCVLVVANIIDAHAGGIGRTVYLDEEERGKFVFEDLREHIRMLEHGFAESHSFAEPRL